MTETNFRLVMPRVEVARVQERLQAAFPEEARTALDVQLFPMNDHAALLRGHIVTAFQAAAPDVSLETVLKRAGVEQIYEMSPADTAPRTSGMVLFFLEQMAGKVSNDDSGVTSQMLEIPGTHYRFLGGRNWLALQPDHEGRYWANWHVEGEKHPYMKVVHPIDFQMAAPRLEAETIITASPGSTE